MNNNQVIYAIYNYITMERARLENKLIDSEKYLNRKSTPARIIRFYHILLKRTYFNEFSQKILDILKFYDE